MAALMVIVVCSFIHTLKREVHMTSLSSSKGYAGITNALHNHNSNQPSSSSSVGYSQTKRSMESTTTTITKERNPLRERSINNINHHPPTGEYKIIKPKLLLSIKPIPTRNNHNRPSLVLTSPTPRNFQTTTPSIRRLGSPIKPSVINSSPSEGRSKGRQLCLDDFELGKILGKGKLGRVYCAKHKSLGLIIALKVMDKQELVNLNLEKNFEREVNIQSMINHENISKLYTWFYDHKNVYLVLEFSLYGELYLHLKKSKRFDNIVASYYIYQVTQALIHLHRHNIIHRDIKPENIMLSRNNIIKLSDFGWSVHHDHSSTVTMNNNATTTTTSSSHHAKRQTVCGTLDYLPPEMIESQPHNHTVDNWALGILCYEFLVGVPPFEEPDKTATYKRIVNIDIKFPKFMDEDAIDLIRRLLMKSPGSRLDLNKVLHHRWIIKNKPHWLRIK